MSGNEVDGTGRIDLATKMAAFDALGPLSRAAIREASRQIGAASLYRALVDAGAKDLADPLYDRAGARAVRETEARIGSSASERFSDRTC